MLFRSFDRKAAELRALGFEVLNPAEMPRPVRADGKTPTHGDYMRSAQRMLLGADVVYLLPGHLTSVGAEAECHTADSIGAPGFDDVASLVAFDGSADGIALRGRAP